MARPAETVEVPLALQERRQRFGSIANISSLLVALLGGEFSDSLLKRGQECARPHRESLDQIFDDAAVIILGGEAGARTRRNTELGRCAR